MSRRGPGWPTVLALVLVVLGFSVFHPLQLLMLPLAFMLVALPPRTPGLVAAGALLGLVVFMAPRGGLWGVERGWSLLLSGWFVLAVMAWPTGPFITRAVAAVLGAAVTGGLLVGLSGGWEPLDWAITARFEEAAEVMGAALAGQENAEAVVQQAAELPAALFPGLLGIASVAALAVGWWGYHRVARSGHALGTLREFRFPDVLVWVLIAGLLLVVLPPTEWAQRVGGNLLFFMGSLYVLRGLGVVLSVVGGHMPTLIAMGVVGLLLWPVLMTGTLLMGVADTWWDLRAAARAARDEG